MFFKQQTYWDKMDENSAPVSYFDETPTRLQPLAECLWTCFLPIFKTIILNDWIILTLEKLVSSYFHGFLRRGRGTLLEVFVCLRNVTFLPHTCSFSNVLDANIIWNNLIIYFTLHYMFISIIVTTSTPTSCPCVCYSCSISALASGSWR